MRVGGGLFGQELLVGHESPSVLAAHEHVHGILVPVADVALLAVEVGQLHGLARVSARDFGLRVSTRR